MMPHQRYPKRCAYAACGKRMQAVAVRRYCSASCRTKAYRDRKGFRPLRPRAFLLP